MQELLAAAKTKGLRLTALRKNLFSIFSQFHAPLSVPELTDSLGVNKTTLYREMETLLAHELIRAIEFGDGKTRYELAHDDHHHFVCEQCGDVEDVENCEVEKTASELQKTKGVLVRRHALEFFGLCARCQ